MDWGHATEMLGVALGGSIPVIIYMMSNKHQARIDVERRHQENQKVLNGLVTERKYFPSHGHGEKAGQLHVEGISYPPEE